MPFEVHPTPAKGKDGKNIVYVRPAMRDKLTMQGLEDFCSRNYGLRFGELGRAFDVFLRAAGEVMAMGYRIDTPIGSFAPRLMLTREITDPDDVSPRDIRFNGVEYNPGKHWNEALERNDGTISANTRVVDCDRVCYYFFLTSDGRMPNSRLKVSRK